MNQDIPVVIFCGGQGMRMRSGTNVKKELVRIGNRPVIWHVMRIFSAHGFNRFVLTLGHEADQIRRYFRDYDFMHRDVTLTLADDTRSPRLRRPAGHPPWEVTLVDTGLQSDKAERLARVEPYLTADRFFVAYGDDVSDVDLSALLAFHRRHGQLATLTAVQIELQYGVVEAEPDGRVTGFIERPQLKQWINGGFMLFEREALPIIRQHANLERGVLPQLAAEKALYVYRHRGFWQSMNTLKDQMLLESMWRNDPPWRIWEDS